MCSLSKRIILNIEKQFAFEMYKGKEPVEKIAKYTKTNSKTVEKWIKEFSETAKEFNNEQSR